MKRPILYLLIPLCVCISYYSASRALPDGHIARLASDQPKKITVKGVIADDPSAQRVSYGGRKIRFLLKVDAVKKDGDWQKAEGLTEARVYTKTDRIFRFGDEAVMEGLLSKPVSLRNPGLFDYAGYLANRNIYSILKVRDGNFIEVITGNPSNPVRRLAYKIRRSMRRALERYLDEPDVSFAKAMLIGDRSGLGNELNDEFIKTGTVHILSISGLHVGLIAGLVLAVFGMLGIPKKINLAATLAFLVVYSYIAGSSPPIIRAVIMFAVFAIGYIIERETDLLNSLAVAALLILLWNPKQLFDPSFQLSFASIASIFIFAPPINAILRSDSIGRDSFRRKAATYILKGVSVSVAAWIGTWPIIAAYFNIASPVSVIANLVVIPLSFVSMIISILLLFASLVSGAAANILAIGMAVSDKALFAINHLLARMPLAYFRIPAPPAACAALYYALVLSWVSPSRAIKRAVLLAALAAFNIAVWAQVLSFARDEARVTFLDVGQGDAAFIELPGGRNFLIDAGNGGEEGRFDMGRSVIAPYLWNRGVRTIDAIIVTHPHADHLGGAIYILENFRVGTVIDNGASDAGPLYKRYARLIKEKGVRRIVVGEGDAVELSPDGKFLALSARKGSPSDANAGSLVGKFVFKKAGVLFCADATDIAMSAMLDSHGDLLASDVVKVPHHGGKVGDYRTIDAFYSKASPKVFIISTGAQSRRDKRHMNIITSSNATCYDTSKRGAVLVTIKSTGYSVKPFVPIN